MKIYYFLTSINTFLYLLVAASIVFYLILFLLSKSRKIASLALLNFYLLLRFIYEVNFDFRIFIAIVLISWTLATLLSLFVAQDNTKESLSRAILKANKKSVIENVFEGILITGAPGSGKTQSVIHPILKHYAKYHFTGVIYDYKDFELTEIALPLFKNSKVNFHCLCFHDVKRSARINPIAPRYIKNEDTLREFFQVIYENIIGTSHEKNPFFKQVSISAVSALTWKFYEDDPKNCNLPFIVGLFSTNSLDSLSKIISSNVRSSALGATFLSSFGSPETSSNVKASISNFLSFFLSPEKFYVLSRDEVNLNLNDPSSPSVLSIINSPSESKAFSPVLACILGTTLKQMSYRERLPGFVLLDEAPTLKLQNASRIPATLRSYNISTLYCMQDKSLSDELQGENTTKAILANLSHLYIGKANDESTARMYQELSSLVKEKQVSFNTSSNPLSVRGENRINTSIREKAGMHKSEFFKFKPGEFYNFSCGNEQKLKFPYKQPNREIPPVINPITDKELEALYCSVLEQTKNYIIENKNA